MKPIPNANVDWRCKVGNINIPNRIKLSCRPSPLQKVDRFSNYFGFGPIYVKRDDLLGCAFGGNKLRKLEFILPSALSTKSTCLITTGSNESNHAFLTAFVSRMLGMNSGLVLMKPEGYNTITMNERLSVSCGAKIYEVTYTPETRFLLGYRVENKVFQIIQEFESNGLRCFRVPAGGCCLEGNLSFFDAENELHQQMRLLNHVSYDIVIAVGTGSSFCGLFTGALSRGADVHVHGVSIARNKPRCAEETYKSVVEVCNHLSLPLPALSSLDITDSEIGGGYGQLTISSQEASAILARTEGILVDSTYTAKALSGLIRFCSDRDCQNRPVVFWHTGGISGAIDGILS